MKLNYTYTKIDPTITMARLASNYMFVEPQWSDGERPLLLVVTYSLGDPEYRLMSVDRGCMYQWDSTVYTDDDAEMFLKRYRPVSGKITFIYEG